VIAPKHPKKYPSNAIEGAFVILAEREREFCARIALEVARRRHLADDEHGASTARQIAAFIREEAFPELRESCEADLKKNRGPLPSSFLLKGEGPTASEQVLKDRDLP
jgi:hypothetical protein